MYYLWRKDRMKSVMKLLILLFSTLTFFKLNAQIEVGAKQFDEYFPLLKGKNIGVVVNQTSVVDDVHIIDCLIEKGINVKKIFSPEHGFRGKADAGEYVKNGIDIETGLPVISLYGSNKKPKTEQINDLDVLLFDIQDVGARFYTYISTMHYVMEACAENNKKMVVLDRPNPNGFYVDGPVLDMSIQSFVGMHPIPIVHGLTVGELALMINGEKWLKGNKTCDLEVIKCKNYTHKSTYNLPIKPSPNLPNMKSIYLYPSLCLIEGTTFSCGRGTNKQFQIYGHPNNNKTKYNFTFTPKPNDGSKNPKHNGKTCYGVNLSSKSTSELKKNKLQLNHILSLYNSFNHSNYQFFNNNNLFDKLAGNTTLKQQLIDKKSEEEIRKSWEPELSDYKKMRKNYLLYPDFD